MIAAKELEYWCFNLACILALTLSLSQYFCSQELLVVLSI